MTLIIVFFTMKQDIFLVSEDYYKQEIKYQDQIDRITNANALEQPLMINYLKSENKIEIIFPKEHADAGINGHIVLFRPSDARLDRKFEVKHDDLGRQLIQVNDFQRGNWKIKVSWESSSNEFFKETVLTLK